MRRLRPFCFAAFFFAAMLLAGCGSPMGEVSGTVKYDSKLIENGSIRFEAADGTTPTAGAMIKNGEYTARVPVGAMKVTISSAKVVGKKKLYANDPNSPEQDLTKEVLPDKYSDTKKTELKFDVHSGANPKDWDLAK